MFQIRIYLTGKTAYLEHRKMWWIIFHGYQDMSQDKGNISVRCQMRGKIYKRPFQWGENAKIHTQKHTDTHHTDTHTKVEF